MAVKTSTGFAAAVLSEETVHSILTGGHIKVYSAPIPASPDDAETGTVLWTITNDGVEPPTGGCQFEFVPAGRTLHKLATETWQGPTHAGTAAYYRYVVANDTGAASTLFPRIQGTAGNQADSDLYLGNPVFTENTAANARTLASYGVTFPIGG